MKSIIFLFTIFFLSFSVDSNGENVVPEHNGTRDEMVVADQKEGNKVGEWSIEINILGIVKYTVKGIRCDKMPDRICYTKQGETGSAVVVTTSDSIFSGVLVSEQEHDFGTCTETEFTFDHDTFSEQ